MTQKADVSTIAPRMAELEAKRQLIRTIMGGTFAMRAAGKTYLPQHPAESDGVYKSRLAKTFLDNFVGKAIDKAAGKIFTKAIKTDNLLPDIEAICENIDRQGRDLDSFMMDVAKQAFEDGISYVLADMPPVNGVRTLAEEKALGIKPYAIHIKPQSVLEILSEMINGVETITRLRIKETTSKPDGWEYVEQDQIRVFYRDIDTNGVVIRWELYQPNEKKEWVKVDEGLTSFKSIYLVPFYTNRCGFMEGEPGFQDIAESTLEHWQWKSEHAHALSMCCFGMLTATGVQPEDQIEVGPAKVLKASSPDASFSYTETTGQGVTLAADNLKAIEDRVASAGVNLRVENAGNVTATAAALDSEETNAGLKAIAQGFGDSVEQLFSYFAEMMNQDASDAEVKFNDDFGQKHGTDAGLTELTKGRALGDLSRKAWIEQLKWRGEIDPEFDIDANEEEIAAEGPALGNISNPVADKNVEV